MPSFSKGHIIYSDEPYATAVLRERLEDTCNWCFAHPCPDPLSCSACSGVVYCSERCREKDSEYHVFECLILNSELSDEMGLKRFVSRTLIRVQRELSTNSPTVSFYFENACTFRDLVTHADCLDDNQRETSLEVCEELVAFLSEHGHEVSTDFAFEVMLKLLINGHCVKSYSSLNALSLGRVLYLGGSKNNHSCEFQDDFIQLFSGNRYVLKALKDFSVSDPLELYIAYIPLQFSYALRQDVLKYTYFFTCKCPRCVEESTKPQPPFLADMERFLLQPFTAESSSQLESLRTRFDRYPNTNFYKNMLLTRLFLEGPRESAEGPRESLERSFALGTSALEGCRLITDRMKILYIICVDLASFGANSPSHEYFCRFKHFHEMTLSLFIDVHGEGHPLVKEIIGMAKLRLCEDGAASPTPSTPEVCAGLTQDA